MATGQARSCFGEPGVSELPFAVLTNRERDVLRLIGQGRANKHIARQLGISERTVKGHASRIFAKLHVGTRVEAAVLVARLAPELTTPAG